MGVERRWGQSDKKASKLLYVTDDDGSGRRLRPAATYQPTWSLSKQSHWGLVNINLDSQRSPHLSQASYAWIYKYIYINTILLYFHVCTSRSVCHVKQSARLAVIGWLCTMPVAMSSKAQICYACNFFDVAAACDEICHKSYISSSQAKRKFKKSYVLQGAQAAQQPHMS